MFRVIVFFLAKPESVEKLSGMLKKIISLFCFALFAGMLAPASALAQAMPSSRQDVSHWEAMFPDGLIKAGQKAKAANKSHIKTLKGKFVGVYSSASWCGPCRAFTPRLVKFYSKNRKGIEIVFRSSDKTENDMIKYVKKDKMKWLAVPFKGACTAKSAGGIPHLAVYAPDGTLFTEISGAGERSFNALEELPKKMKEWHANK